MKKRFSGWIEDQYGSKRGLVRQLKYQLLLQSGFFRKERHIDFRSSGRLVFVCSGNICRSPVAEYYAKSIGLNARSCGLHCPEGDPADPRAIDFAYRQGIDMRHHKTSNISEYQPEAGDVLLVMEPRQLRELKSVLSPSALASDVQCSILPLFAEQPSAYLHDPYNSSPDFFDRCERQVMAAVDGIARRMNSMTP